MNVRCPNCGAVFPAPPEAAAGGAVGCPLCLHTFDAAGMQTLSIAGPAPIAPRAGPPLDLPDGDDEFEAFGTPASGLTSTFGGGFGAPRPGAPAKPGLRPGASGGAAGDFDDPFAQSTKAAKRLDDPFGSPAAGADPFGFGGGSKLESTGDVDFDALLGQVGKEPTGVQKRPAAKAAPTLEDDSLFGGDDDSLFMASANTSGALFDDADELDSGPAPQKSRVPTSAAESATQGPAAQGAPAERGKRKRDLGPLIDRALVGGMLLLGVGLAMDYAGMPAFGLGDLIPSFSFAGLSSGEQAAAKSHERPVAANLLDPTEINDTADRYALEVSRLRQVFDARPDDAQVRRALVSAYLDLQERAPDVFASDIAYKTELDALAPLPPRGMLIAAIIAPGEEPVGPMIEALANGEGADADDLATAAWAQLQLRRQQLRKQALEQPGLISQPQNDPLRVPGADDPKLKLADAWIQKAIELGKTANNRVKLQVIRAQIDDAMERPAAVIERVGEFVDATPDHPLAHELLASALIDANELTRAAAVTKKLATWATETEALPWVISALHLEARMAARRGRTDDQIQALQGAVARNGDDELTVVRLARLYLREKRAQDCQRLLVASKKADMKSIAFEVVFVEYWLWAHRYDDALAELTEATKTYPESVDLLFLRGQVEEQQHHSATARDFFARVLQREPRHVQAALRLTELQREAKRLDDALFTLQSVRERVGDEEAILEPQAQVLLELKRDKESRDIYALLLQKAPSNKRYLLEAARLDLRMGFIDRALGYLTVLRAEGALDRDGAIALAAGLASKDRPKEAAETLVPFAEREPNSVAINAVTGRYLLDAGDLAHAETMLARAHQVALRSGGDAETLFQYGRLAFAKGEVDNGVSRMTQAIHAEQTRHHYRFELARALMKVDRRAHPSAPKIALDQLEYLVAHAPRFAEARNPIDYLPEVHRRAAQLYADEARWSSAIPHLRAAQQLEPNDLDTQVLLGRALFQVNDRGAEGVLRKVVARRPGDARAALYLGLTLIGRGQISEALSFLERASGSNDPAVAEASYHVALIARDRGQNAKALAAVRAFLAHAPSDHPFRRDAQGLLGDLGGR